MTIPFEPLPPTDYLQPGDVWGDGPGDKRVRVHRVDPTNNRAQFRMADRPEKGKRWNLQNTLRVGATVKIRKVLHGERVAMNATVLSVQQSGVTLGGIEFTSYYALNEQSTDPGAHEAPRIAETP